jgi:hypothetical protein
LFPLFAFFAFFIFSCCQLPTCLALFVTNILALISGFIKVEDAFTSSRTFQLFLEGKIQEVKILQGKVKLSGSLTRCSDLLEVRSSQSLSSAQLLKKSVVHP